ncbi:hypothetical protein BDY19DRAFT_1057386 [Irpex rosettiformis]|uniref:Uncharacterized protein n=1 Tax=Irpex rosettiformis TaxID=378272 RepID=A0ACB8U1P6_9APHY|nr:hypothetical protein BDY19DRAFT_1057386 [Irpex rosettiformis]
MSKKASDKTTNSPSSSAIHLASDKILDPKPALADKVNESVADVRLTRLVDWRKTVNEPPTANEPLMMTYEPLSPGDAKEKHRPRSRSLDDGRPARCRGSVWDTVRRSGTAIVAQTANFDVLTELPFASTMFDTASAVQGLSIRETAFYAWVAVRRTLDNHSLQNLSVNAAAIEAAELYLVELGVALANAVTGPHFLFLDPYFGSTAEIVSHALRMIGQYESQDIDRKRLVVSIPASEEGITAAQMLEKEHSIATNLYLVSGFFHAVVCIEAGVSFITFSCKHMDAIVKQQQNSNRVNFRHRSTQQAPEWQWVAEIQATAEYLSLNNCKTRSILADLCGQQFTPELLGSLDCICVRDNMELEKIDLQQSMACSADSDLSSQARQMQYPTTYLAQGTGFLSSSDPQTRSRVSAILRHGVAATRQARRCLYAGMKTEITQYLQFLQLDANALAAMYKEEVLGEQHLNALDRDIHVSRFTNGIGSPVDQNPRINHVGYRIAQIQWDKPFLPNPPASSVRDLQGPLNTIPNDNGLRRRRNSILWQGTIAETPQKHTRFAPEYGPVTGGDTFKELRRQSLEEDNEVF